MISIALALAFAAEGASEAVPAPPDYVTRPVWREHPTLRELSDFYPVGAPGIPGRAVVECTANAAGALENCRAIEETPAGLGFGNASVALASSRFALEPLDRDGREVAGRPVRLPVRWTRETAEDRPPRLTIGSPVWAKGPSDLGVRSAHPRAAWRDKVGGSATMACTLTADGLLAGCVVEQQQPEGMGFGEAALKLSHRFRMKLTDPAFAEGRLVRVELYWDRPVRQQRATSGWSGRVSHPRAPRPTIPPGMPR